MNNRSTCHRFFLIWMLIFAVSQPVVAGNHLFHSNTDQVSTFEHHAHDNSVRGHAHHHHSAPHIDLTISCVETVSVPNDLFTGLTLPEYSAVFYRVSLSPETPPPIFV
jgi:hypothetical protein